MNHSNNRYIFFLSLLAVLFMTGTVFYSAKAEKYGRYIEYSDERSMSELVSQLSQMDSSLAKLRYASTPRSFQTISAKLWQSAENAKSCMAALSLPQNALEKTQRFVAQTGDFAYYLLFASSGGDEISRENLEAIDSLYDASEKVTAEISAIKHQMDVGQMDMGGVTQAMSTDGALMLSDGLSGVEQEFPEYATLIYDGPFSEHLSYAKPRLIENLPEVTIEQAMKNAASFAGVPVTSISLLYEGGDKIKSYCFSASNGATMEVSKQGGLIFEYRLERDVAEPSLSPEQAAAAAEQFLSSHGFKSMKKSYYTVFDGMMTINYAYTQNDIIVYGDLVKVSVALDNGEILGMEARGYLMSHTSRTLARPKVSADEGLKIISGNLTVQSVNLALIPTSGQNEVLCHEYVCTDQNGMHVIVYINALTGQEENIYILIEDENGTLTI